MLFGKSTGNSGLDISVLCGECAPWKFIETSFFANNEGFNLLLVDESAKM